MLDVQKGLRLAIIMGILVTAYMLILAWRDDYANKPSDNPTVANTQPNNAADIPNGSNGTNITNSDVPTATVTPAAVDVPGVTANVKLASNFISVSTDRYEIKIDPVGGDVVHAALHQYDKALDNKAPFVLLESDKKRVYVAQSGLNGRDGIDNQDGRALYQSESQQYVMQQGQQSLVVPLVYEKDGVRVTKTYTFKAGEYPIDVTYTINNQSGKDWQGQLFAQLKRDGSSDPGLANKGVMRMATYLGGAWGTVDEPYNKLTFKNFNDEALNVTTKKGWVAMVQHYFVSAWIPKNFTAQLMSRESQSGDYFIGFNSQPINLATGKQTSLSATLYAGPKKQQELKDLAKGLNQTVDYGFLWPIAQIIFWALFYIHKVLGNWGWSIIAVTIVIKIALLWLSNKSYYSMAKMRAVAPKMQALKEKHGDDRMAMSQEMMQLYKEEKVNPLAGCLPILMQMPIFLALYWVLVESVELRHAPWILWIKDLSVMDPWFVLPIFMGITMFVQQHLNPQPQDPMQAKMLRILPIVFTVFMLFFPAGLVLYWSVNNLFSMTHQHLINKKVEKEQAAKEAVNA